MCSRSINRLLEHNTDFNQVISANTGKWVEESFTYPDAIFWSDMRPTDPTIDESSLAEEIKWLRISDVFDHHFYSLWGSKEISPKDVHQGVLADCWLHASAAAIA